MDPITRAIRTIHRDVADDHGGVNPRTAAVADLAQDGISTAVAGRTADQGAGVRRFARLADARAWLADGLPAGGTPTKGGTR
jgi:hypothetical protein